MDRKTGFLIGILVVLCLLLTIIQSEETKQIDWTPKFQLYEKGPLDLYIFDREVNALSEKAIQKKFQTPYIEFENDTAYHADKNYLFVLPLNVQIDDSSVEELLKYVDAGSKVMISAFTFPQMLRDSLHFQLQPHYNFEIKENEINQAHGLFPSSTFKKVDPKTTRIVSAKKADSLYVEAIEIQYGKGTFYLNGNPYHFSNVDLLHKKQSRKEAAYLLSFINDKPIDWYVNYNANSDRISSPLRFIFENRSLEIAWQLLLLSLFLLMVFRSRRMQRIIPELVPNRNTTVDFVRTIGNLYYNQNNHDDLIKKKLIYFFDRIKSEYFLQTDVLDQTFIRKLRLKAGKPEEEVKALIDLIIRLGNEKVRFTKADLIELNDALDKFFNKKID